MRIMLPIFTGLALLVTGCDADASLKPVFTPLDGTYTLVSENDDLVPSDPSAPNGCCITLNGVLTISDDTYQVQSNYQNKNTGALFSNAELGTVSMDGLVVTFTRVSGGGVGFPFLLAPVTVREPANNLTLYHGDEGPGSNQIKSIYMRLIELPH